MLNSKIVRIVFALSSIACLFNSFQANALQQKLRSFKFQTLHSQHHVRILRSAHILEARSKDDENFIPPPPPPTGRGEWADWDSDSYVEEPYEGEVAEEAEVDEETNVLSKGFDSFIAEKSGQWSPLSSGSKKGENQGMSASDNWPGWSEEAPYFDEDDTQDDEGNWGRSEGADKPGFGAVSGSSDLWTRQTPAEIPKQIISTSSSGSSSSSDVPPLLSAAAGVVTAAASVVSVATAVADAIIPPQPIPVMPVSVYGGSSTNTGSGSSDTLTVVLEMNRQFATMDTKNLLVQSSNERKIDQLTRDVSELKKLLYFIIGSIAVIVLKLLFNA